MERDGSDFTGLVHRDLNWISEARLKFENNLQQKLESRHHSRYQLQVEPFSAFHVPVTCLDTVHALL